MAAAASRGVELEILANFHFFTPEEVLFPAAAAAAGGLGVQLRGSPSLRFTPTGTWNPPPKRPAACTQTIANHHPHSSSRTFGRPYPAFTAAVQSSSHPSQVGSTWIAPKQLFGLPDLLSPALPPQDAFATISARTHWLTLQPRLGNTLQALLAHHPLPASDTRCLSSRQYSTAPP